jgi:hypothetical protein
MMEAFKPKREPMLRETGLRFELNHYKQIIYGPAMPINY